MNNTPADTPSWIVEATEETFDENVFQRSHRVPVVVDFWAPWCQPCRMLGPLLESLADEYQGRFVLVKANTELLPHAAARFAVQSIPAVYALRDGEVVDYFLGLLPEGQIRTWLDRLMPSPAELAVKEGQVLEASDAAAAEKKYREAIQLAPKEAVPKIRLAQLLVSQDRATESAALIAQLEERGFLEPEAEKIKAAIELQLGGKETGSVAECRRKLEQNPDDLTLQFQLAEALAASKQYEEALQICLRLVELDRHGVGESAREIMLDIFRMLPDDSELTSTYRRKLSTALY